MATFAIKCPHCFRNNTSFTIRAIHQRGPKNDGERGYVVETFATCNACVRSVCGTILVSRNDQIAPLMQEGAVKDVTNAVRWSPASPVPDVPGNLPPKVLSAFTEAENLKLSGYASASGNAYRKALEEALRAIDSSLTGTLYSRIEALANKGALTDTMKDFAHRIRNLGNAASHETHEVPSDELGDMAIFTKLFLMYQFTLPGMLPKKDEPPPA